MNRSQASLLLLIAVLSAVAFLVVLPFVEYVAAAAILAYVLYPIHVRFRRHVPARLSAVAVISLSLIALVAPVAYVLYVFVETLRDIARGETGLDVETVEARILDLTGIEVQLSDLLSTGAQRLFEVLFDGVGGLVAGATKALMGVALMTFLLYYLLLEAPAFLAWLRDLVPLPERVTDSLFERLGATTWGVVVGHISVAIGQAILAGVGLWLAGVPSPVFWTFVMAVLALLPLIGAFLVWGPASLYLVAVGDLTAGVVLAAYSLTVVSLFDNYARPIFINRQARLNPAVILVGVVGGIYAIGFTGLFIGPIVVGALAATLETFRTEFEAL
jgi:predicted PurR-regulated permease PerM